MAAIVGWWAIPAVALAAVILWAVWRGRPRKPAGMRETVAHYEQFQAVLTRVVEAEPGGTPDGRAAAARDVP
ncbi:hypothetical protein [Yinghuangia seranimata]|uniref:hypothetical protein n=1 Tax=Yinghuangia seranimata TaxID=408067 RepID=UPI00248AA3F3|nr:hypothetical protein [Yinghuangia seranimata]MDI2128033.1 hypothetical protein [Yinghuangia seranimata]